MFDPHKPTITPHTLTLNSKSGSARDSVLMSGSFSPTDIWTFDGCSVSEGSFPEQSEPGSDSGLDIFGLTGTTFSH